MCFGKTLFRTALIGGLAVGAATIIWHDEAGAIFHQVRGKVSEAVNDAIDDPVVLRQQLQKLSEQLPKKIAELRSELAEVDSQVAQMQRDTEVAHRVVAMTTDDLETLGDRITRAAAIRQDSTGPVQIRFNANRLSITDAKQEFERINQIRLTYEDRLAANERDLGYLGQQRERLTDLLGKLEAEYATIETQMWQIDRKIDAIARSERLAETIEDRESAFEKFGRFDIRSLEQLQSKLHKWEVEVDARLQALDRQFEMKDYEREAEIDLDYRRSADELELPEAEEATSHDDKIALAPTIVE